MEQCPNLSFTKVDDYDLYALLYAGDDNKDSKFTPEQAAQAAENANGRVIGSETDDETAETAEDGEGNSENEVQNNPAPMNRNSIYLVFGAIALIGIGGAGFFVMKKKNGSKAVKQIEPDDASDDEDETLLNEDDEYRFYDGGDENEDE